MAEHVAVVGEFWRGPVLPVYPSTLNDDAMELSVELRPQSCMDGCTWMVNGMADGGWVVGVVGRTRRVSGFIHGSGDQTSNSNIKYGTADRTVYIS